MPFALQTSWRDNMRRKVWQYSLGYKRSFRWSYRNEYRYIPRKPIGTVGVSSLYDTVVLRNTTNGYNAGVPMKKEWFIDTFKGVEYDAVVQHPCSLTPKQWQLIKLEQKL